LRHIDRAAALDELETVLQLLATASAQSALASGTRAGAEPVCDEFLFVNNFHLFYRDHLYPDTGVGAAQSSGGRGGSSPTAGADKGQCMMM
jgi:hypothetical protein